LSDLSSFHADTWQNRATAFYDIVKNANPADLIRLLPSDKEALVSGLDSLLTKENAIIVAASPGTLSEEYVDSYYGDLIESVAILRDTRSVSALLGAVNTGHMATGTLAVLGDTALDATVEKLNDTPPSEDGEETRMSLSSIFAEMSKPTNLARFHNPASRAKLEAALMRLAQDPSPYVRLNAVSGLGRFSDQEARSILVRIADNDPYSVVHNGEDVFPVRDLAKKSLSAK
jgi:hypothetical protein